MGSQYVDVTYLTCILKGIVFLYTVVFGFNGLFRSISAYLLAETPSLACSTLLSAFHLFVHKRPLCNVVKSCDKELGLGGKLPQFRKLHFAIGKA